MCSSIKRPVSHIRFNESKKMKIAYVFATDMATTFKLSTMILPQLERGIHGPQVIGMMFSMIIFLP